MPNFSLSVRRWFPIMFFWGLYEHFTNHLSLRRSISTWKPSIGFVLTWFKFVGLSSLTYNKIPPPNESWSNLCYWNHLLQNSQAIINFCVRYHLKIDVSLNLIDKKFKLFSKRVYICMNLFKFSWCFDFKIVLASILFLSLNENLDLHHSWFNLESSSL